MTALWLLFACSGAPPTPPGPTADMVEIETSSGSFWVDPYEFPNQAGAAPTVYVHAREAAASCEAAGKRLCTAAEWRRACTGPDGRNLYGYGPRWRAGQCHTDEKLPSGHTSIMDPVALVAPTGSYRSCRTPEGVYDLVGNVEEWVTADWRGVDAMLEGGAWYTHQRYADCSGQYSRAPDYRLSPDKEVYSAGFRCCWTPEAPSQEDISADATARLANTPQPDATYDPDAEVALSAGHWMDRWEYPNRPGVPPRTAVTWAEADAACTDAGKRLCDAAEWERACGAAVGQRLPYGDTWIDGACAVELDGPNLTGSHVACATDDGVTDLVGSVWEWTATPLDAPVLRARPGESLKEIRGGSWMVEPRKATCAPTDGYPAAPDDARFPDVGFRCCRGDASQSAPAEQAVTTRCPADMVASPAGCIDRFEYPNTVGQKPRGGLTLADARQVCVQSGKHLCGAEEWTLACAGDAGRRWPYGDVYDPKACHDTASAEDDQGGDARASGRFPRCATPTGVFDLSGNLWEWTDDASGGVMRGGGWNISAGLGQCRARAEAAQDFRGAEAGARCCATPTEARALLRGAG